MKKVALPFNVVKEIANDAGVRILCPWCQADITDYPEDGLAYTKHMVGECCIGIEYE